MLAFGFVFKIFDTFGLAFGFVNGLLGPWRRSGLSAGHLREFHDLRELGSVSRSSFGIPPGALEPSGFSSRLPSCLHSG